jgi:predicted TIM-barrel fold metal-dependent hydrolase
MELVDKAIVFGAPNEFIAEYADTHPEKIVGFAWLNPHQKDAVKELKRCVNDLGLRGLKLYPICQHFYPNDKKVYPIYEAAQELEIPVFFHMGANPGRTCLLKYTSPLYIDDVAVDFPDLTMVICHMGHPYMKDTIMVVRKNPNVYTDVSGPNFPFRAYSCLYNGLVDAMTWGVLDKLLFATDWPLITVEEGLQTLRSVNKFTENTNLPRIPEKAIEAIIDGNAEKALKKTRVFR